MSGRHSTLFAHRRTPCSKALIPLNLRFNLPHDIAYRLPTYIAEMPANLPDRYPRLLPAHINRCGTGFVPPPAPHPKSFYPPHAKLLPHCVLYLLKINFLSQPPPRWP